MDEKEKQQRTKRQNRALHLFFTHLSEGLNESGLDMKKVLAPEVDIPWTSISVKEFLFSPIMKAMFNKESTTELNTDEMTQVYEAINRIVGKHGVHVPFPSIEEQSLQALIKDDGL